MRYSLLFVTALTVLVSAQVPRPALPAPAPATAEKKPEDKKPEKPDTWLFIKNVDVYPVSGPSLRHVGILVKNDKIESIGDGIEVPKDAVVLDATGLRAYPGMIQVNGAGLLSTSRGAAKDGVDPFALKTVMALAHGITTVISGTSALKMVYGSVEGALVRENIYVGLFYSSRNPRGKQTLLGDLRKVRDFMTAQTEFEDKKRAGDTEAKAPEEKGLGNAAQYLPLFQHRSTAVFNVDDQHALIEVCEIVAEFGFKAMVRGASEGWTVAPLLGRAGVTAVVIPRTKQDTPPPTINRPNGPSIENAAILWRAGVPIVVTTANSAVEIDGMAGGDVLSLASEAGFAIRGGLPADAGLASVTLEAARAFGMDDRIGSLAPGLDADIVVTDGDLLHYATMVQWAIVNGKVAYDKSKESLYRHIRPRDPSQALGQPIWPRRFGPAPEEWRFTPKVEAPTSAPTSRPESAPSPGSESRPQSAESLPAAPESRPSSGN